MRTLHDVCSNFVRLARAALTTGFVAVTLSSCGNSDAGFAPEEDATAAVLSAIQAVTQGIRPASVRFENFKPDVTNRLNEAMDDYQWTTETADDAASRRDCERFVNLVLTFGSRSPSQYVMGYDKVYVYSDSTGSIEIGTILAKRVLGKWQSDAQPDFRGSGLDVERSGYDVPRC